MNWDDLRIFLALARTRRLEPASRMTALDPSTVSRRIIRLEAALGVTLFEQSRQGHVLTERGQTLLAHAEAVERATGAASGDLTGEVGVLSGFVRASVSEGFGTWIIGRHLPAFHAAHPHVTIDLVASGGFLNPSRREADVAIMLARPAKGPLLSRRLTDYRLSLYASQGYLADRGMPEQPEDLHHHTLVGFVPDLIQAPQQRLLEEISASLTPTLRSTSINAQAALIASGAGIGVLPCFIGEQLHGLVAVLPDVLSVKRTFWLVVHRDVRRLARVDAFVTWVSDVVRSDQPLFKGRSTAEL